MYSLAWFDTFAQSVPAEVLETELDAIEALAPPAEFPEALDIGCGVGRASAGLVRRGYHVTGIDVNAELLAVARDRVPEARFLQLPQQRMAELTGPYDVALILWHSIGYTSRADDELTLRAAAQVLRPGGLLLLDLYHPDWLATHGRKEYRDERGATVSRHVHDGRCVNHIEYTTGDVDHIEFNVYAPNEITRLATAAGFDVALPIAWWRPDLPASGEHARFQLACWRSAPGSRILHDDAP